MKKLLYIISFIASSNLIISQSNDWKQMDVPTQNFNIYIFFGSTNGTFIGDLRSGHHVYSVDKGVNWQRMNASDSIYFDCYFNKDDSSVFAMRKNELFSFDIKKNIVRKIFTINGIIYNVGSLGNDRFVVTNGIDLFIIDSNGKVYNSKTEKLPINFIINESKDKIVCYGGDSLSSFVKVLDLNLNELSIDKYADTNINNRSVAFFNKNRLFLGGKFTDDFGKNWQLFFSESYTHIFKNQKDDCLILISNWGNVFISKDNGLSFVDQNTYMSPKYSYMIDNELYFTIFSSKDCNTELIFKSIDNAKIFSNVKLKIPFVDNKFIVGNNEAILYKNCDSLYIKSNVLDIFRDNKQFSTLQNFISMPNNDIIGWNENEAYRTSDFGNTWIFDAKFPIQQDAIISFLNNDNLHINFNKNTYNYTYDNGKNWESKNLNIYPFCGIKNNAISITKDFKLIYNKGLIGNLVVKDIQKSDSIIYKRFSTGLCLDLKVSTKNTNTFYGLYLSQSNSDTNLIIAKSNNLGQNIEMVIPPFTKTTSQDWIIKIDSFNNVYVYNNLKVYMSKDSANTWKDITPIHINLLFINSLEVSNDGYVYIGSTGAGILKYNQLVTPPAAPIQKNIYSYPNPTTGIIHLSIKDFKAQEYKLQMFDYTGRIILESNININKLDIDLTNYPTGIYIIEMQSALDAFVGKVVKQ